MSFSDLAGQLDESIENGMGIFNARRDGLEAMKDDIIRIILVNGGSVAGRVVNVSGDAITLKNRGGRQSIVPKLSVSTINIIQEKSPFGF